ncbi:MAG: DUF3943 domain-containing protein [Spirochaetaceae bacterium]|nr:DUF3943 domain-containing protein [Spirochaetaceae bacterium]
MKKILLFFVFITLVCSIFANTNGSISSSDSTETQIVFDSTTLENSDFKPKKHYLAAAGGVLLQNILLYSWNYFLIGAGWTQVTFDDLIHFYEKPLEFDTDYYWTNFVLHPYQGSLYYMTARASNLNQFESFLYSVLGSAIWEWFCETNDPSINDMVYTTLAAWPLGEMLHRLSFELEAVHSWLRFLGNPMRLYTEPVTRSKPLGTSGNLQSFSLKVGFGLESGKTYATGFDTLKEFYPAFGKVGFDVLYNDPFTHKTTHPFDQFHLKMEGSLGPGIGIGHKELEEKLAYDITLFTDGMLYSWALPRGNIDAVVGFSMNYDFLWNSFFEFTSIAPGVSYKQRVNFENSSFLWETNLGYMLLGTTDFYYFRRNLVQPEDRSRSYNFNIGVELYERLGWKWNNGHIIDFTLHGFAAYDFDDPDCDTYPGWEFYGLAQLAYDFPVSKSIKVGAEYNLWAKYALYKDLPNVFSIMHGANIYAKWVLK